MFCMAPSTCKVIEIISKQALQIFNILMYMCAQTEFKTELKKWQFPSGWNLDYDFKQSNIYGDKEKLFVTGSSRGKS